MNIESTNGMYMVSAETLAHIQATLKALSSIKGMSADLETSLDKGDENGNRFLQNEIFLQANDESLNKSIEQLGAFFNGQPLTNARGNIQTSSDTFALTNPSDEIIQAAFGMYTTDVLGRAAWDLMHAEGLDAVLEENDARVNERLDGMDTHVIANMIDDFVSNAQALAIQQRKSTFVEVEQAVSELSSIEEVMDYLTTELETMRQHDPLHEADVIKLYTEKTIQVFEEKIQSKEITLKDVPKLISRYGLMSSYQFMRHIDEMMQVIDVEKARFGDDDIHYGMGLDYLQNQGFKFTPIPNSKRWNWSIPDGLNNFAESLDEAIDDVLSMTFPESDWERAVEKGEFGGSWEQYVRTELTQKHSEICMRDCGRYVGKIQKIENGIVYQQIGRTQMDVQLHALMKFDTVPKVGDALDIKYKDGKVVAKPLGKPIER